MNESNTWYNYKIQEWEVQNINKEGGTKKDTYEKCSQPVSYGDTTQIYS